MHDGEIRATSTQLRALLKAQWPGSDAFPISVIPEDQEGTDHVLFRLGDSLLARLPKVAWSTAEAESDARWLEFLAPQLPVTIPVPRLVGKPGAGYPWAWTVVPWVTGTALPATGCADVTVASELAEFVRALHAVKGDQGPQQPPGSRGAPLIHFDERLRPILPRLDSEVVGGDVSAALAAWEVCLSAPDWDSEPVWIHADLQPGNLITTDGHLTGVIDFGALGVGDPAPDLAPALWTFTGAASSVFRDTLGYDEATWLRACGWALGPALIGVDYHRISKPGLSDFARRLIQAVVAEVL